MGPGASQGKGKLGLRPWTLYPLQLRVTWAWGQGGKARCGWEGGVVRAPVNAAL